MAVDYRLLGSVEAFRDGVPVALGGPRQRAVLVILLTRADALVPAVRVIDELWEGGPPASAANLVQGYVSALRKALGRDAIETRGAGYVVRAGPERLDLRRFERLAAAGEDALAAGRPGEAAERLRAALGEWRGPALGDLVGEPFLQGVAARLDELRLLTLESCLEAELATGDLGGVLREIGGLVEEHPFRERLRRLQMLALYRAGRQAEALEAYRAARSRLRDDLGIEPGPELQDLERAILRQDASLEGPAGVAVPPVEERTRSLMLVGLADDAVGRLVTLAEPLARRPAHEIILVRTVGEAARLGEADARLRAEREALLARGAPARCACFTSLTPGADMARLASEQDVDLVLVDGPDGLLEDGRLGALLDQAPSDVAVAVGGPLRDGPVLVPFTGAEHDWAAVELGAWLALDGRGLRLAGSAAAADGRDASRLLASASLAVQRGLGVAAEPLLVDPDPAALVAAAADAGAVVVGLTDRWRREGLGRTRTALAAMAEPAVLLARRGVRPGGLAPRRDQTRFTWTIAG